MGRIAEEFGKLVFNDHTMQERLPSATYKALSKTVKEGRPLDPEVANVVAHSMKEWAVQHGATHYTHWFQPLTGITSEKHDAFINPQSDGRAIMSFSGKELIQGEPDASSFPSGGLRATFEARGYTAWDPTSYAFIKDEVLCIPTAFCSYTGEALDKKTPLLRSMSAISEQARAVLKLFGHDDFTQVQATVGPEQEYFLIKEEDYEKRQDLILTGRTLFGAPPCKGQELEEHYFGAIRPTVNEFMKELDSELWKLGISAKTKHNEVAPAQHELAPIFTTCNAAIDHNLVTMEMMKKIASHHGLVCLQHEKPFDGINGSGKHDNWSLGAPGLNLFEPGDDALENLRFLVFLTAVVEAVDEYQDLLRTSVASAGNDHRLGANEAPPAIISIFLGDELTALAEAVIENKEFKSAGQVRMDLGVATLPNFLKDNTDRNRTSPFAFTGNKFEFRMPGSAVNLADANTVLNTAVAKTLKNYLEAVADAEDFESATLAYVKKSLTEHQRIIFNGDGYSEEWPIEAEKRGLSNLRSTVDALPCLIEEKNVALFEEFGVLSRVETESRYEVKLEHYSKILNIEGLTMSHMAKRKIAPAISKFANEVATTITTKKAACPGIEPTADIALLNRLNDGANIMALAIDKLDVAIEKAQSIEDTYTNACAYHDEVLPAMVELRAVADDMEGIVSTEAWPVPTYNKILFYI
ncbi:MAG: glutamine synthetase type III [Actinobacteria bacterium]|nr:glutamine synthetase type III [Actinomycetota bacterium]